MTKTNFALVCRYHSFNAVNNPSSKKSPRMTIQHISKDPSKIINWANGTSIEVFLYPSTSSFQNQDFLFRISIATVEAEQTTFTSLPLTDRTLMVLKGKLVLHHTGQHQKTLQPFDQDNFKGGWETISYGIATNFNLMCRVGTKGIIKHYHATRNSPLTFEFSSTIEIVYLHTGTAKFNESLLSAGDSLIIEKGQYRSFQVICDENCDFVQVSIDLQEK